jgi:hypothetical protein
MQLATPLRMCDANDDNAGLRPDGRRLLMTWDHFFDSWGARLGDEIVAEFRRNRRLRYVGLPMVAGAGASLGAAQGGPVLLLPVGLALLAGMLGDMLVIRRSRIKLAALLGARLDRSLRPKDLPRQWRAGDYDWWLRTLLS